MIKNFINLGELISIQLGLDKNEDKKLFLDNISIMPKIKTIIDKEKEALKKPICINFDLEKNLFSFEYDDKDLVEENREYFFAFKVGAPKDKKKFLMTNNIESFLEKTIKESLEYLENNNNIVKDEYIDLLKDIQKRFFVEQMDENNKKKYFLNPALLKQNQKEFFDEIKNNEKSIKDENEELFLKLINKIFIGVESKDKKRWGNIFLIKFNGKTILEYDNEKYKNDYINLVHYDLFDRFFDEKLVLKNKKCFGCNENTNVIKEISIPIKFFGTTNNLYFENLKSKNAYKSFTLCKKCLKKILLGMSYTENKLSNFIFGANVYFIPKIEDDEIKINKYNEINRLLVEILKKQNFSIAIQELKNFIEKLNRKNMKFDLLFYEKKQAAFNIFKNIYNVELKNFIGLADKLLEYSKILTDELSNSKISSLNFVNIRYLLFSSSKSDKNPDFNVYGKKLLSFFDNLLTNKPIEYDFIVNNFVNIYKKIDKKKNVNDFLGALKMNIFLQILADLKILKGGKYIMSGENFTQVLNEDYNKFFENHKAVYEENKFRQGLFLLGVMVDKIRYAQDKKANQNKEKNNPDIKERGKKKGRSSNILSKLNYSAMSARRVNKFIVKLKELQEIYKNYIFEEKWLWGGIMDRLQGIESTSIAGEEIIFYMLTGISFSAYLAVKKGKEKEILEEEVIYDDDVKEVDEEINE
ncbi:MAG: hypothetical protein LBF97_04080 [Elusimicrobiota bacterium]|nr:hypothetical protein [Elusimicrobiota bacterium]